MLPAPKGYKYTHQIDYPSLPTSKARRRVGAPRDVEANADIEALANIVGSKNARDITRKNHFMSKPGFDKWNSKQPEGKYWGDYVDLDDDGIEEFVVRGRNEHGPLVAVNGYTTKNSDWAVRRDYYEAYPFIGKRPAGGISEFARTLYEEEYDQYGNPTEAYLGRIKDARKKYPGHSIRAGGSSSPYNIFVKRIVSNALKQEQNDLGVSDEQFKTIMKEIEAQEGKGWLLRLAAKLWSRWVKKPIIEGMDTKTTKAWRELYYRNNPRLSDSKQDHDKFIKWFFNRKDVKATVKDFVQDMFVVDSQDYSDAIDAFAYEIDKLVAKALPDQQSPPTSPGKHRYLEKYGLNEN